jgi:predicted nucleic acid-binding protein
LTSGALYVDTSAALRAVLEAGTSPEIEARLAEADVLITSRLSVVESARALARARLELRLPEDRLADASRQLDQLWSRCEIWALSEGVCDLAGTIVPNQPLRTLDALHLATYLMARRRLGSIDLLTADDRLRRAADSA